jgi:hypothetical protein
MEADAGTLKENLEMMLGHLSVTQLSAATTV